VGFLFNGAYLCYPSLSALACALKNRGGYPDGRGTTGRIAETKVEVKCMLEKDR